MNIFMNIKTKFALYAESVSVLNDSSRISCLCNSLTSHTSNMQHLCNSGDRHAALTYYTITPPLISKCQTPLNLPNIYPLYSHSGKSLEIVQRARPVPLFRAMLVCV